MTIEALEVLPGWDYDQKRGYSRWLFVRFPIYNPCQLTLNKRRQITEAARAAFVERYSEEPLLIQNIEGSAWWRAGPIEKGEGDATD